MNRAQITWTICFLPILMTIGNSAIIPVLPIIGEEYQVTDVQTSLLITSFSLIAAFAIPLIGIAADRIGRRKMILFGLILFALSSIWIAVAAWNKQPFSTLLIARSLQGIGGACTSPLAMVIAGDLYQGQQKTKVMGLLESSNALGKVLSPFIGTFIGTISWIFTFLLYPLLCLPLIFLARKLPETKSDNQLSRNQYLKQIRRAFYLHGHWLWISYFLGVFVQLIFFGYYAKLSDLWGGIELPVWLKGIILTLPFFFFSLSSFIIGKRNKHGIRFLKQHLYLGLSLLGVGSGILFLFGLSPLYALLSVSAIGLGVGAIFPSLNILITNAIHRSERGIITSLYHSVRFFGVAIGPPLISLYGNQTSFLIINLLLILSSIAFVYRFIYAPQRIHGPGDESRILIRKQRLHSV